VDPLFFALHSGLAHEAPGRREDTLRALALTGLSGPLQVLDAGCGPGAASLALLAALPEAHVTAIDLHPPFVEAARAAAEAAGVADRVTALVADMAAPPVAPGALDLVWSEGAAYSVGVETALAAWRPLVVPGGRLAFTEAVWLTATPHPDARAFWEEYQEMTDAAGTRARAARAGWRVTDDFVLPEAAWDAYYRPLEARVDALAALHGEDHPVIAEHRREIALRRAHPDDYGYAFFVAAPA
jgi:SAM-dependent methyltransferase